MYVAVSLLVTQDSYAAIRSEVVPVCLCYSLTELLIIEFSKQWCKYHLYFISVHTLQVTMWASTTSVLTLPTEAQASTGLYINIWLNLTSYSESEKSPKLLSMTRSTLSCQACNKPLWEFVVWNWLLFSIISSLMLLFHTDIKEHIRLWVISKYCSFTNTRW